MLLEEQIKIHEHIRIIKDRYEELKTKYKEYEEILNQDENNDEDATKARLEIMKNINEIICEAETRKNAYLHNVKKIAESLKKKRQEIEKLYCDVKKITEKNRL